jgi:hypothetical protein
MNKRNEHQNAETWFLAAIDAVRPWFKEIETEDVKYDIPSPVNVDHSFTEHGTRKGPTGSFWSGATMSNGVPKVIIRSNTADPFKLLEALMHQLVHAVVGPEHKHGMPFKACALPLGLVGPMSHSTAGVRLTARLKTLEEDLGPFPRGAHNFEAQGPDGNERKQRLVADVEEAQRCRQLKAECPVPGCGYVARVTALHLRRGAPLCGVHKVAMLHEELPADPDQPQSPEQEAKPVRLPEPALLTYSPEGEAGQGPDQHAAGDDA